MLQNWISYSGEDNDYEQFQVFVPGQEKILAGKNRFVQVVNSYCDTFPFKTIVVEILQL